MVYDVHMANDMQDTIPPIFDTADRVRALVAGREPMQTAIKRVVAADLITRKLRGEGVDSGVIIDDTIEASRHAAAVQIMGVVHGVETGDPYTVMRIAVENFDVKTATQLAEWLCGSKYAELKSALDAHFADA